MAVPAKCLGGMKDKTRSAKKKLSLVHVDLLHSGIVLADLVLDPRDSQAFTGGLSLSACGGAFGECFCDMADGLNRIESGLS